MKDVKHPLQTAYFTLLNGNVVIPKEVWPAPIRPASDYTVPVYDNIPANVTYPYIKLGEWTEVDDSDKSSFGSDLTLTTQIVDRYSGAITRAPLYSAANGMKKIIRARPSPFDLDAFNVVTTIIDNENSFKDLTDT